MSNTARTKPKRNAKPKTQGSEKPRDAPPEVSRRHPDAHHGAPVTGCACWLCWTHRAMWRREERDRLIATVWDAAHGHEPRDIQVRVGQDASRAFAEVMGALPM